MVDIKTAVATAIEYAKDSLGPERTQHIRLEETESSRVNGDDVWLITLSMALKDEGPLSALRSSMVDVLGANPAREYKVFTVAKSSGEVLSMKIRLLSTLATT
jgi:hypothetical protein